MSVKKFRKTFIASGVLCVSIFIAMIIEEWPSYTNSYERHIFVILGSLLLAIAVLNTFLSLWNAYFQARNENDGGYPILTRAILTFGLMGFGLACVSIARSLPDRISGATINAIVGFSILGGMINMISITVSSKYGDKHKIKKTTRNSND